MVCSSLLSPSPGTTGLSCLIHSLCTGRTSTPPTSPSSPAHPSSRNLRVCTALLLTAFTVIIGPVTLITFFFVVRTPRRCHGPHRRAALLGSSAVRSIVWFCTGNSPRRHCGHCAVVGAGSVLGVCVHFFCVVAARLTTHGNWAWGCTGMSCLAAQRRVTVPRIIWTS